MFNENGYLAAGLHDMELDEVQSNFVHAFPSSNTRGIIFEGYKQHKQEMESLSIVFEQFINGSFTTTKNDPSDIDMVCFADADAVNNLSPADQQKLLSLVAGKDTQSVYHCDCYFSPVVPDDHPDYNKLRASRKYWMGEFGFDRQERAKGIVRCIIKGGSHA